MTSRRAALIAAVLFAIVLGGVHALWPSPAAHAQSLPKPSGPVILSVSGKVGEVNDGDAARFDLAMLDRLPQSEVATHTPWTEGEQRFSGVRLGELLRLLEAAGSELTLHALNDYSVDMDLRRYIAFGPLLATRRNGQTMAIADKGPVWLVFPEDDYPELNAARVHDLWVWQLTEIRVE